MNKQTPSLKQLRYLVALADCGQFSNAAELCGIAQPSLSVQIQNLEETLGAHLIERHRTGIMLTPLGREVVERARAILLDVQGLVDVAATAANQPLGTVRLGVKPTLGPYLLPQVVAGLHRAHPDLKLYIRESAPHQLETELIHGTHDVILAQLPVASSGLVVERLFREPVYLAVSAEHRLAKSDGTVSVSDLEGLPVLSLTPDYHLHDQVHAICEEFGATLVREYEGTSLDALRQMVAMNIGATFLPALYVRSEIAGKHDVVALSLRERRIARSIGLVWRESAGRVPVFRDIAGTIRQVLRDDFPMLVREG